MLRGSRRAARVAVPLLAVPMLVVSTAFVASAETCPFYTDEQSVAQIRESCRTTSIVANNGALHTEDSLGALRSYYEPLGFEAAFWDTARIETVVVYADSAEQWTYCEDRDRPSTTPCPRDKIGTSPIVRSFHPSAFPVRLQRLTDGRRSIFLACGNTSEHSASLTGVKFEDRNANGVRDAGEPTLGGWTMRLSREASNVGAPLGEVATTVTEPDGSYVFALSGDAPGRYRVTEDQRDGWRQTTADPEAVVFPAGEHETYRLAPLGNVRSVDFAKAAFRLVSRPDRMEVDQPATFVIEADITATGGQDAVPFVDRVLATVPQDCTAVVDPERVEASVRPGTTYTARFVVTVTCTNRSNHPMTFLDVLAPGADVEDPNSGNNSAQIDVDEMPVFEEVDLSVGSPYVRCLRPLAPTRYECTVTAIVGNAQSNTPVAARTTTTLAGAPDCLITPPVTLDHVLASDSSAPVTASFVATCAAGPHTFLATVAVAVNEPHAEDHTAGNDQTRVRWVQTDVKPNSDPSSINRDKQGAVPVAILSTPDFDAVTEIVVDADTLRFGPTGTERSLLSCATAGEDVNGDGLADLVCHFDTAQAGFTCADRLGELSGVLKDGTPFWSQDPVKITPCRT